MQDDVKDLLAYKARSEEKWENQAVINGRVDDLESALMRLNASMLVAKMRWGVVQVVGQFLGTVAGGIVVGVAVYYMKK